MWNIKTTIQAMSFYDVINGERLEKILRQNFNQHLENLLIELNRSKYTVQCRLYTLYIVRLNILYNVRLSTLYNFT